MKERLESRGGAGYSSHPSSPWRGAAGAGGDSEDPRLRTSSPSFLPSAGGGAAAGASLASRLEVALPSGAHMDAAGCDGDAAGSGGGWLNAQLPLPESAGVRFGDSTASPRTSSGHGPWSSSPFMADAAAGTHRRHEQQPLSPGAAAVGAANHRDRGYSGPDEYDRRAARRLTAPVRVGALTAASVVWDRTYGDCTPQIRQVLTAEEIAMLKKKSTAEAAAFVRPSTSGI